ncbi:MAG: extracellular solute-binding protein [Chloroflexi bacterium]|nr:extracellular solute-binding protein [Chloroflexota bacterium]
MKSRGITRRAFGTGFGGAAAGVFGVVGVLAAACGMPGAGGTQAAPTESAGSAKRNYQGVVFQHLAKGAGVPDRRNYQRLIDEVFEPAHPGIKVEIIPDGGIGYWEKLLALLAAGTPPDAAQQDEYFMAHLIKKNQLLELTPYQVKDKSFNYKDMFEGAWRAGHFKDKLYGISAGIFGPMVKFNQDHFDEVGLPYPPLDYKPGGWTWNQMREQAKKLTKRDPSGNVTRAGFAWDARFLSRFSGHFYAYGARVVDRLDDPTKCVLDEPRSVEFLQFLHDLRHVDRTAAPAAWYDFGGSRTKGLPGDNGALFRDGKLAITIELINLAATRETNLRWDYAPLPRPNSGGKAGGFVGSNVFTGMKASRDPQLTWDWISAMGGPKYHEMRMRDPDLLSTPAWKALQAEYAKLTPPDNIRANIDLGEYGTSSIMSTAYVEMQDEILNGLQPAWNNEVPVRQAVAEVVRKVNDLLREASK